MLKISSLKEIGLGVVVKDKNNTSNIIDVLPLELITLADGQITSNIDSINGIITDAKNNKINSSINIGAAIKAEWLRGNNSNRLTSPDVRIGERVRLFQYSNLHKFYWQTSHGDFDTRDNEHVVYLYVADKEKGSKEIDSDLNGYTITISSRDGYLELNTTKSNNEKFQYNIKLDCKGGKFELKDDVENRIYLDSSQNDIQFKNGNNSFIRLNKENITEECTGTYRVKCKNYILECEEKSEKSKKSEEATDVLSIDAKSGKVTGESLTLDTPTALAGGVTGNTNFEGDIESSTGTLSVKEIAVTDNIRAGGNITGANWP